MLCTVNSCRIFVFFWNSINWIEIEITQRNTIQLQLMLLSFQSWDVLTSIGIATCRQGEANSSFCLDWLMANKQDFCLFLPLHLDVAIDLPPLEIESGYTPAHIWQKTQQHWRHLSCLCAKAMLWVTTQLPWWECNLWPPCYRSITLTSLIPFPKSCTWTASSMSNCTLVEHDVPFGKIFCWSKLAPGHESSCQKYPHVENFVTSWKFIDSNIDIHHHTVQ